MDLILVRLIFIVFVAITCYLIRPFGLNTELDAAVGVLLGWGGFGGSWCKSLFQVGAC